MKRFSKIFLPNVGIYLVIIAVCILNSFIEDPAYRLSFCMVLFLMALLYTLAEKLTKQRRFFKYIEGINAELEFKNKNAIQKFPLPLLITTLDGQIISYNELFNNICNVEAEDNLLTELLNKILKDKGNTKDAIFEDIQIRDLHYSVVGNYASISNNSIGEKNLAIMYFIDNTNELYLEQKLKDTKLVSSIIVIDNYEELTQSTDESIKPQILAEIDVKLGNWCAPSNGILKKFERDKYIFIFEEQYLKYFEEKKFEIIDTVKEISVGNKIPVTLSIGIGIKAENFFDSFKIAMAAIDIGLGRGGDQVVINDGSKLTFYGGRSKDVEKRTRVKSRVIAQGFEELMNQSDKVIIMGHENSDMDVIGAALGLFRMAKERDKEARIVLNNVNVGIKNLVDKVQSDKEYENLFINNNTALDMITKDTLLVVVDTHRPAFTECPELLEFSQKIIVIDHHRKGAEFINNAVLVFHETFASSACEMITEMNYYIKANFTLIEAEALYSGIALDTKNFTVKTGARTFEAAATLKRIGVDTLNIKKLFQNDYEAIEARADVVKKVEINDNIAISVCSNSNVKELQLVTAQAADELLEINGVEASFVLCKINNEIIISGRSMGNINVQVILEKLGGGGHMTVAGAQVQNKKIDEVKELLKEKIAEYFAEQQ